MTIPPVGRGARALAVGEATVRQAPSGPRTVRAGVFASATQRAPQRSRAAPVTAPRPLTGRGAGACSRTRPVLARSQTSPAGVATRALAPGAAGPAGASSP